MSRVLLGLWLSVCAVVIVAQGPPALSDNVKGFVRVNAATIALTNVRVIDGTGAPPRDRQTVVLRDGTIAQVGDTSRVTVPAGAEVIDLQGRSVMPGLVMVHEHLYYPTGPGVYGQLGESFTRLYLAGGVTTLRTGGNMNGYKRVALTSTLTVFETFTPGRPLPPGLDVLTPQLKHQFEQAYARVSQNKESLYSSLLPKAMALERAFARAGGLLIAGTDPTGAGGVIPGYSNQRQIELLVDAGFSPLEAISIATLNGARYLGREKSIGTIVAGKQADLVVVTGDPTTRVADVRNVEIVFKQGVGFDPAKLIASVSGRVGLF
jgi:imidazolonepropionase-like amidohydrolase